MDGLVLWLVCAFVLRVCMCCDTVGRSARLLGSLIILLAYGQFFLLFFVLVCSGLVWSVRSTRVQVGLILV